MAHAIETWIAEDGEEYATIPPLPSPSLADEWRGAYLATRDGEEAVVLPPAEGE